VAARIANVAMLEPVAGSGGVCVSGEYRVWSQAVGFNVGASGRNLASVTVKMF
jgi:hypothetical protein